MNVANQKEKRNDYIQIATPLSFEQEIDVLARTIYGEARGEYAKTGLSALIAIGNVVMNRVAEKKWYGSTVESVCKKPFQFSCWNENDSNFKMLSEPTIKTDIFLICKEVAKKLLLNLYPDLTKGSNHYYASYMKTPPSWAKKSLPQVVLGKHLFFRI